MKTVLRTLTLGLVILLVAIGIRMVFAPRVSGSALAPHLGALTAHANVSPEYTNCLWTGNSITAGTNLPAQYPSAYEGYMLNDLDTQRNANDCKPGHYKYVGQSGWCASQGLANMQANSYHPAVDFAVVQYGEDEYANASGCRRSPAQYQADLSILLAYIVANSPALTLICFDVWEPSGVVNSQGFTPEQYSAAAEAACSASGAQSVVIINLTALYPTAQYHGVQMANGDTYHPDPWADVAIGQEIVNELP